MRAADPPTVRRQDGVDSVSFEIPKGKVIPRSAPNGAGKSTVLNIISA